MKTALIHDWLTGMRGGEYVLEAIAELFPRPDLFTLLYVPGKISPTLTTLKRRTSWLQKVPGAEKRYRHFLPFMPGMIEKFDLTGYDLIISSSHCVAKGIQKPEGSVHVSYIHAPMRYMWDRYEDYFGAGRSSVWVRAAARWVRPRLQKWDREASSEQRIDKLIANSQYIADQIEQNYGRKAEVIHPFANLERFAQARSPGKNYFMVTAFAPYKRVDIAIEAFNRMKLPLLIVGSGQDQARLKKLAGPTVEFLGSLSNSAIADLYSKCRAFIFPGVEDFGITPLEAMASGAPVIAFKEGGVTETVTEKTGIFFHPQSVESLMQAVSKLEAEPLSFSDAECRKRAAEFSKTAFQTRFKQAVINAWSQAGKPLDDLNSILLI
ncbi:MAG: glycosyltransferase [Bdellovibrio sp.]|nr:glycosyltransferase [Bdellovibrio sp.]